MYNLYIWDPVPWSASLVVIYTGRCTLDMREGPRDLSLLYSGSNPSHAGKDLKKLEWLRCEHPFRNLVKSPSTSVGRDSISGRYALRLRLEPVMTNTAGHPGPGCRKNIVRKTRGAETQHRMPIPMLRYSDGINWASDRSLGRGNESLT